jgi:Ca2+-transporting ATPase
MIHCRSLKDNLLKIGFFSNPTVFMGIGVILALQALFIYLPLMQRVFRTASLSPADIGLTAAAAFMIFPVITLEKWIRSLARNRQSTRCKIRSTLSKDWHGPIAPSRKTKILQH